jgi:hypothetical protein
VNKRIQELAVQAGFTEWHRMDNPNGDAVIQAFAELIVHECMDNLEFHGHDQAVSQLKWLQANRFGVK